MIFDSDDFGVNHVISDQCQSHDCRDILDKLHIANPKFKATMFTIPGEVSLELLGWCQANAGWVEIAVHGFFHGSNYECEKMSYEDFGFYMDSFAPLLGGFVKGFKAPGWQISDGAYQWLLENGYWVADQPYNDERRPKDLPVYKLRDNSVHTHTWDCVGNGVYQLYDELLEQVKEAEEFYFISEVLDAEK